jgi:hypothetical protein
MGQNDNAGLQPRSATWSSSIPAPIAYTPSKEREAARRSLHRWRWVWWRWRHWAVQLRRAGQVAGSGGYSKKVIPSPKATYVVAVGAGGAAPAAGNNPGNAGGDTSFDSGTVLAKGVRAAGAER